MTRNNADFQQSVLYHGSPHAFSVGDVVLPSMYFKKNGNLIAYASSDPQDAKGYAEGKAVNSDAQVTVYTVEPVDPNDVRSVPSGYVGVNGITHHTSVKGFKVTGKVD